MKCISIMITLEQKQRISKIVYEMERHDRLLALRKKQILEDTIKLRDDMRVNVQKKKDLLNELIELKQTSL